MRIDGVLKIISVLAISVSFVHSQPIPLISVSDTPWRYYQGGNEPTNAAQPGVSWKDPVFDDSAWSEGLGVFGFEDSTPLPAPIKTPLLLTAPGATNQTRAYYFRAHFHWAGSSNAVLWCTNLLDDGAVFYLNGVELYRLRVTGTPTYETLASTGPSEGLYEITNRFTNRLLPGENNLAVEVHQASVVSGDVVFGLGVTATIPEGVTITKQPPALVNAVVSYDISFSVEATGSDVRYRWYRNDVPINAATNATLTLLNFAAVQAGTYHVVVSNVMGTVRSSNTVVRAIPDTFGPRLQSAVVLAAEVNRLYLFFDEDIRRNDGRSTNVANYVITEIGTTNRVEVTNVIVGVGNAALRLNAASNFDRSKEYQVCVFNISDNRTNFIAMNSCVSIGFETVTNSFGYGSLWFLYEWAFPPPTNWNQVDYVEDPVLWHEAQGLFYNQTGGTVNPPCSPRGWILTSGFDRYYFRKKFTVPASLVGIPMTAVLQSVVDDGAIFYLNGKEIARTNAPGGANACRTNQAAVDNLLRATNVLAVELLQFTASEPELAFDASLSLRYVQTPPWPSEPVTLQYSNHSPTELRLYWTNGMGYALEEADDFSNPWRELQPPSTNVVVNKNGPSRFYRLNKRH